MTEPIARVCNCGRRYTESEWNSRCERWGVRRPNFRRTLEMIRCDSCGSAISRRVE